MKHTRLVVSLVAVCVLLSVGGCGPKEEIIETAAGEMNFSTAELGSGWQMVEETGLEAMPEMEDMSHVRDANMRMFTPEGELGMVMSYVFSTKSVAAAEKEMASGEVIPGFVDGIKSELPEVSIATLDPPDIGDEAVMVGGDHPDLDINIYMVCFRKANVIDMFAVLGSQDSVTQDSAVGYARKLEAKIH